MSWRGLLVWRGLHSVRRPAVNARSRSTYSVRYNECRWRTRVPERRAVSGRCQRIAGYDDPGELSFDLVTEAVHPANAWTGPGTGHFNQHIRVTGSLRLGEEVVPIDCISMRDRTWSPRPDLGLPTVLGSYLHGAASAGEWFLAMARGGEEHMRTVAHGEDQETWIPPTAFQRRPGLGRRKD